MSEADKIIAFLKDADESFSQQNKAALKGCYSFEDKAELRAEMTGHNIATHEAIRIVREVFGERQPA